MKKLSIILLGTVACFWATDGPASTITVNWDGTGDYITIQSAIEDANDLDTIIVADGIYTENISFGGKNIILTSVDPNDWSVVEATVIDGQGLDSVVRFDGTESSYCKLTGFTITNGYGPTDKSGGGISSVGRTNATISNCIIKDNTAQKKGGGIRRVNGLIDRCIIFGNSVFYHGGGLHCCDGTISNCLIYDNSARLKGGGMSNCNGNITNCTIADNTAGQSGGGLGISIGPVTNCIIWGNDPEQINVSSYYRYNRVKYSCVQDFYAGVGNINTVPGFVDAAGADYHLRFDSPCVDAGTNEPIIELGLDADIDGNLRPFDGDHDGVSAIDMGAYEVSPPQAPYMSLNKNLFTFHCLESGPNPAEQIMEIRNQGTGSFGWDIADDCDWLEVWPISGVTAKKANEVGLRVDSAGLEAGGYICVLTISSRRAVNSPLTVLVVLNIYNEGDIIVPLDYPTIQGAIDDANDGQTIIVEPGTYNENIDFGGKNITLCSIKPENKIVAERTIIQGDGTGPVVKFSGFEDPNCRLAGFTITGGNARKYNGGGIRGKWTLATVANCIIKNNTANREGGGIYGVNGRIDSCKIFGNYTGYGGSGIAYCDGKIVNCLVYENWWEGYVGGGGIVMCNGDIVNCTVVKNSGGEYGGGILWCRGTITNCLVWGNGHPQVWTPDESIVTYCCIQNWNHGGVGNITTDPLFIDAQRDDYRLSLSSACIDVGDNSIVDSNSTDLDGNPRIINGIVDMGAYEALLPIEADVHIVPRVINRNNRLKRVMAIIRLPEGIAKGDVVPKSFELYAGGLDDEPVGAILERVIGRGNMTRVFAIFSKDEVMNAVEDDGRVELTVVGRLESGQYIYGRDTVRIILPRRDVKRIRARLKRF